ncbi:MAG: nucleotide exchange factor GrpE [Tissierellia bacterium]|nr:nucleotide exchange factor GrpE [Tissierellia bacterium]
MLEGNGTNKELEDIQEEEVPTEENTEGIIADKDNEIQELNNRLLRLQADFINYRKRAEKEKLSSINFAIEPFVSSLLPIIDNFERALDAEANKEDNFYKGVEMIYGQLIKALKDNGVEEIDALGKDFDPNFHHAVFMEENDEYESGKIVEVLQKGYIFKDKVIRPSMVKVAK